MTASPLSEYVLVEHLRRGGAADVHRGHHANRPEHPVAVKVLRSDAQHRSDDARRMRREAQLLGTITDRHLLACLDAGDTDDRRPFTVFPLAAGGSLSDRLVAGVPGDPGAARRIVDGIADGIGALHAHGVVHCDVHPGNMLIVPRGPENADSPPRLLGDHEDLVICDLGIAVDAEHPRPNRLFGTPLFRAPEQADPHGTITTATDVFGATATLWSVVTGASPPHPDEIDDSVSALPEHWRRTLAGGFGSGSPRETSISAWRDLVIDALEHDDSDVASHE